MRHPPEWGAALQAFCESDPIVCRRVEVARSCRLDITAADVEPARVLVVGSGRCFDYHHSGVQSLEPSFNLTQEDGSASGALSGRIDCDPVEIVSAISAGRGPVAGKAGQLLFRGEGAEKEIVGAGWSVVKKSWCCALYCERRSKNFIEELDCNIDLLFAKDFRSHENVTHSRPVCCGEVADKNSRARRRDRLLRREPHHVDDTARRASIPERRSERCHSSGFVSIF